ncbi:MAG: hypothetical protein ACP5HS_06905 [Anaerolineae bacterium]
MPSLKDNGLVVAVSSAGVLFILLGLLALALPPSQEGVELWQLGPLHAIYLMDAAGAFALGLGVALTWVGGKLWNRQLLS